MSQHLNTPILFIIFNRPDQTNKVFSEIKNARPKKLFIAADGPRKNVSNDVFLCNETKKILNQIDWPCEIKTLLREKNLGCKIAVSSAISWFFEYVEEGIILEDDCLPSQSFFLYCESLLNSYRHDHRIMMISGYNKQNIWEASDKDYFFSNLGGIWGWATWKRAWKLYDVNMSNLESLKNTKYFETLLGKKNGKIRHKQFEDVLKNNVDTWDYQWAFTRHIHKGLSCVPNKNLIKNIGFDTNATHTKTRDASVCTEIHEMIFPLRDNLEVIADDKYDFLFFDDIQINFLSRIKNKIKRSLFNQ